MDERVRQTGINDDLIVPGVFYQKLYRIGLFEPGVVRAGITEWDDQQLAQSVEHIVHRELVYPAQPLFTK